MFVPFENINPGAKIWIFQSSRPFTNDEEQAIRTRGMEFVEQWTAHKQNLLASIEIFHSLFIILAVDQTVNDASGCSIDKAFGFITQTENDFQITLLDRKAVAFEKDGRIQVASLADFERLYKEGIVSSETIMFNNLVESKQGLSQNWRQPVKESWLMQLM